MFELALGCFAAFLAWWPRYKLWQRWKAEPHRFFYEGAPLPVDTDAAYYVLAAQGETLGHSQNLLSWILAKCSPSLSTKDLLLTGNYMLMATAPLAALMVFGAFWALGHPLAGAVAAVGATNSGLQQARSTIGRIDTDQLNVAFLVVILAMLVRLGSVSTDQEFVFTLAALGAAAFLYDLWFPKPIFLLVFSLGVSIAGWTALGPYAIPVGLAFFLIVGWRQLPDLLKYAQLLTRAYLRPATSTVHNGTPAQRTVSELELIGLRESWRYLAGELALVPLFAFGLLAMAVDGNPATLMCLFLLLFLAFSLSRGQRFLPYAAPAVWFAIGYAVEVPLVSFLLCLLAYHTSTHKEVINLPRFGPEITFGFTRMAELPKGRVITWWDYGFWVRLWSGHDVLTDPQAPWANEVTWLAFTLARTDASAEQDFVDSYADYQGPVYVLATRDMLGWWDAIRRIAGCPDRPLADTFLNRLLTNKVDHTKLKPVGAIDQLMIVYEVQR